MCSCNSIASVPLLAPIWARTRDPLHTSTTVTHEASLPIAPQKTWPLQSKWRNFFQASERVTSPTETLLARTTANQLAVSHRPHSHQVLSSGLVTGYQYVPEAPVHQEWCCGHCRRLSLRSRSLCCLTSPNGENGEMDRQLMSSLIISNFYFKLFYIFKYFLKTALLAKGL